MVRYSLIVVFVMSFIFVQAQNESEWYLVKFADKLYNEYSLDNPGEFLSQRAIERRERYNIPLDNSDLPISTSYKIDVTNLGASIRNEIKWFNTLIVVVDNQDVAQQIEELEFVSSVTLVNKPDWAKSSVDKFELEMKTSHEEQDKSVASTQNLDYGLAENQILMLNGHVLHNAGYKGEDMVIAVLDAGFLNANQLAPLSPLFENNQILSTKNYVYPEEDVFAEQNHGHGTMVLSTMGANVPGEMIGTAPNASYHLIVTEDRAAETIMEEYFWVDGAEYADSVGADIINSSLGYTTFDHPDDSHVYENDMDGDTAPASIGADLAARKGILVCNSAGNSGGSDWYYISAPADADSVLTVGAVNKDGLSAYFSSHGPSADGRVKPNVVAKGEQATLVDVNGNITTGNGTSFSSPIMAGAAACLWQVNRDLSNMDIIESLEVSASHYSFPNDDMGYGIPDLQVAMETILGTNNYTSNHILRLLQNPVMDQLVLEFDIEGVQNFIIEIVDINGRLIQNETKTVEGKSNVHIPIKENLNSGVYMIVVRSEKVTDKISFIKL